MIKLTAWIIHILSSFGVLCRFFCRLCVARYIAIWSIISILFYQFFIVFQLFELTLLRDILLFTLCLFLSYLLRLFFINFYFLSWNLNLFCYFINFLLFFINNLTCRCFALNMFLIWWYLCLVPFYSHK